MTEPAAASRPRVPRARKGAPAAVDLLADAMARLSAHPTQALELARAAAAAPRASQRVRCDAARAEGEALRRTAQWPQALAALQRSIDLAVALRDPYREARATLSRGVSYALLGRREAALADYRTTLLLAVRHRYDELAAFALNNIGLICEQLEDFRRALHFIEQAWAMVQTPTGGALQLLNLGVLLSRVGEGSRAIPVLEQAIPLAEARGDQVARLNAMACLADVQSRLRTQSPAAVERLFREIIDEAERRGLADCEAGARSLFAEHVLREGRIDEALTEGERALRLLDGVPQGMQRRVTLTWLAPAYAQVGRWQDAYEALRQASESRRVLITSDEDNRVRAALVCIDIELRTVRALLGADVSASSRHRLLAALSSAFASGQPGALAAEPAADDAAGSAASPPLSADERRTLALVARGLTNAQIAGQLGCSAHTVRNRLARIMPKLGVSSRAAAVAVAQRRGILRG